jgi:hypothetical protein
MTSHDCPKRSGQPQTIRLWKNLPHWFADDYTPWLAILRQDIDAAMSRDVPVVNQIYLTGSL